MTSASNAVMTYNITPRIYAVRWSKHSDGISLIGRLVTERTHES